MEAKDDILFLVVGDYVFGALEEDVAPLVNLHSLSIQYGELVVSRTALYEITPKQRLKSYEEIIKRDILVHWKVENHVGARYAAAGG